MTKNEIHLDLQKIITQEIYIDEPMSKHTSFRIGGNADLFVKANSVEQARLIQDYAKKNKIPLTVIGNGSNLLVSDDGIEGIVIKIDIQKLEIENNEENVIATVGAGNKLAAIAHTLMTKGISGMEELSGIPGTIGGALTMNAGAYGKEIKDIVISSKCLDEEGKVIEFSNEEHQFEYRNSVFKNKQYIILETRLKLLAKEKEEIKEKMQEYMAKRTSSQPIEFPSAGSTFKRGDGFITAKVIDECGLKGYKIGDAEVSTKHAGFIVNKGKATAQDVLDLIEYVKNTVNEKTGLEIEEEVEFIGKKR